MKLIANVDGGARGNPGPAAIGVVLRDPAGEVLLERAEVIGRATNNVAEYRAVLAALELASELGASELEVIGDSQLVVEQVRGNWKVKDAGLRPLHAEVRKAARGLDSFAISHVRREHNADADRLVNEALDAA